MSSTIEGSDDRAREDELDLGQEDEVQAPNGILDHGDSPADGPMVDGEEEPSALHVLDASGTVKFSPQANESPQRQVPTGALGSADETASTPDDTPSLHVSCGYLLVDIC